MVHDDSLAASTDSVVEKSEAASDLECTNSSDTLEKPDSDYGYGSQWVVIRQVAVILFPTAPAWMPAIGYISACASDTVSLGASLPTPGDTLRIVYLGARPRKLVDVVLREVFLDTI